MKVTTRKNSLFIEEDPQENALIEADVVEEAAIDQPWNFWKWIIPIYLSVICVSMLLLGSYWITVVNSEEFLLDSRFDKEAIWDLLATLPPALMLVEWPFNMIPVDWPMLIFVELLFTFYLVINFVIVSFKDDHETLYIAFDWYHHPGRSFIFVFVCYVVLAVEFAFFWLITNKWKLPKYKETRQTLLGVSSFSSTGHTEALDEDEDETDLANHSSINKDNINQTQS